MQIAFEDAGKNFTIRDLPQSLVPILFAKKLSRFFISQSQKAKHGDIVPRHGSSPASGMRLRLIT